MFICNGRRPGASLRARDDDTPHHAEDAAVSATGFSEVKPLRCTTGLKVVSVFLNLRQFHGKTAEPCSTTSKGTHMVQRMLRPSVVIEITGKSRSGLYADAAHGLYTRPVKLGPRASAWPEHEVEAIQAALIAGHSADEIKALVRRLEAERGKGCAMSEALARGGDAK